MATATATDLAERHRAGLKTIGARLAAVLAARWQHLDLDNPQASWAALSPAAEGAFAAAQAAAAGMADLFVSQAASAQGLAPQVSARFDPGALVVDPWAFAGESTSGLALESLLGIPAARTARALASGVSVRDAKAAGALALQMYAQTEVADAGRLASQAAMVTHHVSGYIRHVGALCCSRCAVLSGRWYRFSSGFRRHPRCVCTCVPASRDFTITTPQDLYREGRITDLTKADRQALDLGADISQVVNAKRGVYVAGGQSYTTSGTTRRGTAGARMLARRIAEAGGAPAGGTYANFTVTRREVAEATARYGPLMRRGVPFQRRTSAGAETSAYFRAGARPSVSTILETAGSQDEARRLLLHYGYTMRRSGAIARTAS